MARILAPSNPRSANSAIAALRIEARVSIERCCSALLSGRSRRPVASLVFFTIWSSINIVPNRAPSEVLLLPRSRRPASVIGVVEEFPNRISLDGARIPIGRLDCRIGGYIQIGIRHADLTKRD